MVKTVCAFAFVCVASLCAAASAVEGPHAPRLAAAGGAVAGGFQINPGDEGTFSLFSARENGDDLRLLGQFHGRLGGVALDGGGAVLALTRDGALSRYGDDIEPLAPPDSRWSMIELLWADGAPLAFNKDGGTLYSVRPGGDGEWAQDAVAAEEIGEVARVEGVVLPDGVHLVIASFAEDLSRGALRHFVRAAGGGAWEELPSLPLGDVAAFAAAPVAGGLGVVAVRRDAILPDRAEATFHVWRGDAWEREELPGGAEEALAEARSFTAAASGDSFDAAWLVAGRNGAFFTPAGRDPGTASVRVGEAAAPAGGWSRWSSLATLAGLAALVAIYCRRSRMLSRAMPGTPPDLFSRGAALAADWATVSVLMSGYHIMNGDVLILDRLLTLEDVEAVFWANLAGLIVFTSVFEMLFGRTPGKFFAGLRVRSAFGGPASGLQLLLRNVLRVFDMFPLPFGFPGLVGAIATLLGKRRQRIGDVLARTVVLRHRPLAEREFLLASGSPRRLELLGAMGLSVRTEAMDIDEGIPESEGAPDAVCRLSQEKARAAAGRIRGGEIVIAADTVVVLDGRLLGKPGSAEEAKAMLSGLSGRSHQVFTGVTVWDTATGQGVTEYEETEVEFRALSDREIDNYVASGEPMDKAGGYGVQSGFLIRQVRGSLSNVVGLPVEKLRVMLGALDS